MSAILCIVFLLLLKKYHAMPTSTVINELDEDSIVFPTPTQPIFPEDFQPIFRDGSPSSPPSSDNNGNTTSENRSYDSEEQQYPMQFPNAGCRIEYETVFDVDEVETEEQICNTIFEQQCETKHRQKCVPYNDDECKDIWVNRCNTAYRQECQQLIREETENYIEDSCRNILVKRCEKRWEKKSFNRKIWVDIPNKCKNFKKRKCIPVSKTRTNKKPYTECKQVPFQHCNGVMEKICYQVRREKCKDEPWEDCKSIPRQQCKNEHKITPKQVAKQVAVRLCDDGFSNDVVPKDKDTAKNEKEDTNNEQYIPENEDDVDYEDDDDTERSGRDGTIDDYENGIENNAIHFPNDEIPITPTPERRIPGIRPRLSNN